MRLKPASNETVVWAVGFFGVISKYAMGRLGMSTLLPSAGEASAYENHVATNSIPRTRPSDGWS